MLRLQAKILAHPSLVQGFFGRTGGLSEGVFGSLNCGPGSGDDPTTVRRNRKLVEDALQGSVLLSAYQTHGARAVAVTAGGDDEPRPQADGMVTTIKGLALGILTADCAPVLFADVASGVIGAAHAGWKGALAGITDSTILAMEALGARREQIRAAIGPCISMANYEVDDGFREHFLTVDRDNARFFSRSGRPGHCQFDLAQYVVDRLRKAGLREVEHVARCTYARVDDYFSFRRTVHRGEKDYGRQISAIALR